MGLRLPIRYYRCSRCCPPQTQGPGQSPSPHLPCRSLMPNGGRGSPSWGTPRITQSPCTSAFRNRHLPRWGGQCCGTSRGCYHPASGVGASLGRGWGLGSRRPGCGTVQGLRRCCRLYLRPGQIRHWPHCCWVRLQAPGHA